MKSKEGFFLKENSSSSNAFVLLEALFALMLAGVALSLFGFYLSLPKYPIKNQNISYPLEMLSIQEVNLTSSHLIFKAKRIRLKEGDNIYTAFEAF